MPEDFAADVVEVWPENWPAFELFVKLDTQWRSDFGKSTGLCYEAVYPLLDRLRLSPEEWDERFEDIRVMEKAALAAMHSK